MEKYVIEKKIGQGSYGGVFIVHLKNNPEKRYVLKRVPLNTLSSKEKKSAEQEVALLRKLQHPNIVRYKDSFLDNKDRDLCIVMRYCEGGDLSSKLKQFNGRAIPESMIMKWFVQITLALEFIHNRKILHRDLKSQNVFLTKEGQVKLGDFGIARVLNRTVDLAQTSIGTPLYMSPECCNNKPYSFKSDVWSLGCILYEMCTGGRHPFNARDLNGLFMKIIRGIYSPIPSNFSTRMKELVSVTLNTNPQKRPTLSKIMKNYVSKYAIEYMKEFETELMKNLNCTTSVDMERIELNNLKLQVQDLGIPFEKAPPAPVRSKSESNISDQPTERAKAPSAASNLERYTPLHNPAPNVPRRIRPIAQKVEAKINALERERQKYQMAIEKLKEEKIARAKRIAERSNKLHEMREQKRQRESELRIPYEGKLKPPPQVINSPKDVIHKAVQSNPKYRQDVENLKQVMAAKEKWQKEVGRLQNEIDALQKKGGSVDTKDAAPSTSSVDGDNLHSPRRRLVRNMSSALPVPSYAIQKIEPKPMNDKERVLLEKERKKQEEEEKYMQRLKEGRMMVQKEKISAQQLNARQYQPSQPNPLIQPTQSKQRIYSFEEDQEDEELIHKLEDGLLHATRKIENLRKSIAAAKGSEVVIQDEDDSDYENLEVDEEESEEDDEDDNIQFGRLSDRVTFLRNQCQKVFGLEFERIYTQAKALSEKNLFAQSDSKRIKRLTTALGINNPKVAEYCYLIDDLLFVEGTM